LTRICSAARSPTIAATPPISTETPPSPRACGWMPRPRHSAMAAAERVLGGRHLGADPLTGRGGSRPRREPAPPREPRAPARWAPERFASSSQPITTVKALDTRATHPPGTSAEGTAAATRRPAAPPPLARARRAPPGPRVRRPPLASSHAECACTLERLFRRSSICPVTERPIDRSRDTHRTLSRRWGSRARSAPSALAVASPTWTTVPASTAR
jgi:hypothetical protein